MALTCTLQRSRTRESSCQYSLNSVKDIWLANLEEITSIAYASEENEVSGITLSGDSKFYHIAPATNSASYTDALTVGNNDMRYRTHTLNFSITGEYDKNAVLDLHALSLGEFIGIAKLATGKYVMLGTDAVGLKATTAQYTGAATSGDFSGIEIVMAADVTRESAPLSDDAVEAMLANVA